MNPLSTRRKFLKASATAAAGLIFSSTYIFSQTPAKKRPLKKGYMFKTFPESKLSTLEKFKLLKAAGFDGVEPHSHMDRDEVLKARDASGLEIASISCGDHTRMLSEAAPSQRQKGLDGLLYALESAKAFGAKSVLVALGAVSEHNSYAENYKRTQEEIKKALPLAEKLGVVMAIENVWNNFLLSPLEAARYVDEFNSPMVGWHFDVGNVMNIGWPEHWIKILGKRIQKIHIKEFSRKKMNEQGMRKGFSVDYLEGDNNWPVVMKSLDEIGYIGWAIVENACGECKQSMEVEAYLKKVSGQLDKILAS
jgi:L-ribulose-5-phosphate 3-epimerase